MGRGAGRPPGRPVLQRAALVEAAGRGGRDRAGHAVRLPIVVGRPVDYARIDPELSRELFIRHALVEGDWRSDHRFLAANRALLEDVEELEHRTRRRGLVVGDDALFDFYDQRVPADVVSGRHFDAWWKKARRTDPDLLTFTRELLLESDVDTADTPDEWTQGGLTLPVAYRFEPGAPDDGVTVEVPLAALNRVRPDGFDWQVPALREELVTALIRSLPKPLRRNFVPAPDVARAVLARLEPGREPLVEALARELRRASGQDVPITAFDWAKVPAHLRTTFRVTDGPKTARPGQGPGAAAAPARPDRAGRALRRGPVAGAHRADHLDGRDDPPHVHRGGYERAGRLPGTGGPGRHRLAHRAAHRGGAAIRAAGPASGGCCCSACRPRSSGSPAGWTTGPS